MLQSWEGGKAEKGMVCVCNEMQNESVTVEGE